MDVERYIYIYVYIHIYRWWGWNDRPCLFPHSAIRSVSVAPCPPHQARALMYEVEKVVCPVVVGVSDSGTTRLLPSYRWRACVTVFHVYVRTPRDYAQRRTRDIVRRRETNAILDARLRGRPVRNFTRRVSGRRILFARGTNRGRWNKTRPGFKGFRSCVFLHSDFAESSSKAWLWFRLFDCTSSDNQHNESEGENSPRGLDAIKTRRDVIFVPSTSSFFCRWKRAFGFRAEGRKETRSLDPARSAWPTSDWLYLDEVGQPVLAEKSITTARIWSFIRYRIRFRTSQIERKESPTDRLLERNFFSFHRC